MKKHKSQFWNIIARDGTVYGKEILELKDKHQRENTIIETFLKFYEFKYRIKLPEQITERDAPHDFTLSDENGVAYVEIASVRDSYYGIKIQAIQSKLEQETINNKSSHVIYISPDITLKETNKIIELINNETLEVQSVDEKDSEFVNELIKGGKSKVFKISNSGGKRIILTSTDYNNNFDQLVIKSIEEKEAKNYSNQTEMILLIDDRSRMFDRQHIFAFLDEVIEYAEKSPFKEIYLMSFRYIDENGKQAFTLYPIKSYVDKTLRIRKFLIKINNKWYSKPILFIFRIYSYFSKDWHRSKSHP